jgi:hypothetical protein
MNAAVALAFLLVQAATPGALRGELPSWARSTVERFESRRRLALSNRLDPDFLEADFNGDGRNDLAVLVSGVENRKDGILIVFRDQAKVMLLGAGVPFGNGGDDFSWMDVWSVHPRRPIERGAGKAPPLLRGDALLVEKSEAASAIVYWNGKAFRWYQQGD